MNLEMPLLAPAAPVRKLLITRLLKAQTTNHMKTLKSQTALKIALLAVALLAIAPLSNATIFYYTVSLDGPSESPVNASPGVGSGTVEYNNLAHTLALSVSFSGLTGNTTASHIHAPTLIPLSGTAGV